MARRKPAKKPRVTLKIPAELYASLAELVEGTGFRSVNDFVVHLLRDVVVGGKLQEREPALTPTEVEAVRRRLRALGYIE